MSFGLPMDVAHSRRCQTKTSLFPLFDVSEYSGEDGIMHILADLLTTLRFLLSLAILYVGLLEGPTSGIATASLLTILAWVTDVLDGPLARHARHQTHLGNLDLAADLGLTLALTVCLITWGILPFSVVAGGVLLTGVGIRALHQMAPLQLAMGLIYGAFILGTLQIAPIWGRTLTGGVALAIVLNPTRAWNKVTGFLADARAILSGQRVDQER